MALVEVGIGGQAPARRLARGLYIALTRATQRLHLIGDLPTR